MEAHIVHAWVACFFIFFLLSGSALPVQVISENQLSNPGVTAVLLLDRLAGFSVLVTFLDMGLSKTGRAWLSGRYPHLNEMHGHGKGEGGTPVQNDYQAFIHRYRFELVEGGKGKSDLLYFRKKKKEEQVPWFFDKPPFQASWQLTEILVFPVHNFSRKRDDDEQMPCGSGSGLQDCCMVCMDEMEESEELIRAPCGHLFHLRCYFNWYTRREAESETPPPSERAGDTEVDEVGSDIMSLSLHSGSVNQDSDHEEIEGVVSDSEGGLLEGGDHNLDGAMASSELPGEVLSRVCPARCKETLPDDLEEGMRSLVTNLLRNRLEEITERLESEPSATDSFGYCSAGASAGMVFELDLSETEVSELTELIRVVPSDGLSCEFQRSNWPGYISLAIQIIHRAGRSYFDGSSDNMTRLRSAIINLEVAYRYRMMVGDQERREIEDGYYRSRMHRGELLLDRYVRDSDDVQWLYDAVDDFTFVVEHSVGELLRNAHNINAQARAYRGIENHEIFQEVLSHHSSELIDVNNSDYAEDRQDLFRALDDWIYAHTHGDDTVRRLVRPYILGNINLGARLLRSEFIHGGRRNLESIERVVFYFRFWVNHQRNNEEARLGLAMALFQQFRARLAQFTNHERLTVGNVILLSDGLNEALLHFNTLTLSQESNLRSVVHSCQWLSDILQRLNAFFHNPNVDPRQITALHQELQRLVAEIQNADPDFSEQINFESLKQTFTHIEFSETVHAQAVSGVYRRGRISLGWFDQYCQRLQGRYDVLSVDSLERSSLFSQLLRCRMIRARIRVYFILRARSFNHMEAVQNQLQPAVEDLQFIQGNNDAGSELYEQARMMLEALLQVQASL